MPRATKSTAKTSACTCLVCGKAFRRNFELNRHLATHAPNVDELKAECPYDGCLFKTLQDSNLKTHIVTKHLNLRPHKCMIGECTASFGDMSNLIRHEKNVHGHHRSGTSAVSKYSRKTAIKKTEVKLEDEEIDLSMPVSGCSTTGLSDAGSSSGSLSPFPPSPFMSGMSIPSQHQPSYQLQADALNEANQFYASNLPNFYPDLAFWSIPPPSSDPFVQSSSNQQQFPTIDSNAVATVFGSTSQDWMTEPTIDSNAVTTVFGSTSQDWMTELVSSSPSYSSDAWSFLYPVDAETSGQGSSQVYNWSSF